MSATLIASPAHRFGLDDMAKKPRVPKTPTRTVRVHEDVAVLIGTCASAEDKQAPEWLSELLRPLLQERLKGSTNKLLPPDQQCVPKKK